MDAVNSRVVDMVTSVHSPGATNVITSEDVRTWLRGLLADYALEFADTPELLSTQALWDLIAVDTDPAEQAVFVAVVIQGNAVRFIAGRGPAVDVRAFGDSGFPKDPATTIEALQAQFPATSRPVTLSRADVVRWLQ
jgi:hypothetical protein